MKAKFKCVGVSPQLPLDFSPSTYKINNTSAVTDLNVFKEKKKSSVKIISKRNTALSALLKEAESLKW
jgi:hypothetical protein